jgi:hypothetical protein
MMAGAPPPLLLLLLLLRSAGGVPPRPTAVTLYTGENNVGGAPWRASTPTIRYLGLYNSTQQCEWACIAGPSPLGSHCCAFTYHTPRFEAGNSQGWARQCYAVIDGKWSPSPLANITSGRLTWPPGSAAAAACSSAPAPAPAPGPAPLPHARHPHGAPPHGPCADALDCGLNGDCVAGVCACRPAWTGARCQTLALLPSSLTAAGYRGVTADGKNLSSWGGAVLYSNETKLYHMFLSEFLNSCGLATWTVNSQVTHATSASLDQPFQKVSTVNLLGRYGATTEPIEPHFAHEPVVTRGPAGEWVMFWTGCDSTAKPPSSAVCRPAFAAGAGGPVDCSALGDGSTPPGLGGTRIKSSDNTWMAWAPHPDGPWSKPVVVRMRKRASPTFSS